MDTEEIRARINPQEFRYATSRSSGPGGQNVNKVNTKVELRFNVPGSSSLTDSEKELVMSVLPGRITGEGDMLVTSQSERTQLQNKKKAEDILFKLLAKALTVKPERKKTRPSAASKERRLAGKKLRSNIKNLRKDAAGDDI